jgi:hypothetical protein
MAAQQVNVDDTPKVFHRPLGKRSHRPRNASGGYQHSGCSERFAGLSSGRLNRLLVRNVDLASRHLTVAAKLNLSR